MLDTFLQALQGSSIATAIREGERLFPWIECLHVLALAIVVGSIATVDLRLIGLASRDRGVAQVTAAVLPVTWSAFACAVISGGLLFSSNATTYGHNVYFQVKMALILLAGINMGIFHLFVGREMESWRTAALTPRRAKVAGAVSLCLWIAVVACGRWIGFTINTPT
ncbi:MAG: hypothetical protein JSR67_09035 [Proteobacteria bacterium]|nr:hypothetical protein [Pseudomonadota bacterium]